MKNKILMTTAEIVLGLAMIFAGYPSLLAIFSKIGYFGLAYIGTLILLIGLMVILDRKTVSRIIKDTLLAFLSVLILWFIYVVIKEGWWSLMGFVGILLTAGGVHIVVETFRDINRKRNIKNVYQNSFEEILAMFMVFSGALITLVLLVLFVVDFIKKKGLFDYVNLDTLVGPMLLAGGLLIFASNEEDKKK